MAEDIEDVSFLPGDSLNRKSLYEPSIPQRCRQLVCSQRKATIFVVVMGVFILVIALIAAFARSGSRTCADQSAESKPSKSTPVEDYIATNGEKFPWRDVRLPTSVSPLEYDIHLHPNLTERKFSGKVTIKCKVVKSTDFIVLHSKDLTISKILLTVESVEKKITKKLEYIKNEQMYLKLESSIPVGKNILITLDFEAKLVKKLSGFYLSSYEDSKKVTRYLAVTQFEATAAREAFPCFDEPAMKAKFSMSIVRDKDYISLFNMPRVSSKPYKENLVLDQFQQSVQMSTYLVAFIVCDFASITNKTKAGTDVTVYAPRDQIDEAHFALHVAVTVLECYNKLFDIPYPLPKQDLVAIPDFSSGAMENWGLITYRMTAVLYDPKHSSTRDKEWVAIVVAHELAHQWFGNLVTMEWWDDLWLNEGFATFVEYLGTESLKESWAMENQFFELTLIPALKRDSLKSSHPIATPVHNPDQINDLFDSISYFKGASVIRMLRSFLGNADFNSGISNYLKKYKYSNAVTNDLWQALSEASKQKIDVTSVMNTWTKQMGYPVVTVTRQESKVSLTQSRYLSFHNSTIKEEFQSPFSYKWHVPFIYGVMDHNGKFTQNKIWLHMTSASVDLDSNIKLIKGNYGNSGYYRVNYDTGTWQTLIQQLNNNHKVFSQGDRAGLISDAFEFARSGLLNVTIPLQMTKYLENEEDYLPWSSAISGLTYIKQRIQDRDEVTLLKKYVLKLMENQLKRLGWKSEGEYLTRRLRTLLIYVALEYGKQDVVKKATDRFKQWMKNTDQIDPELQDVIFDAGVMYGSEADWTFVKNQYLTVLVPSKKKQLMKALAKSKDDSILARYLNYALDSKIIKHQDIATVINYVGGNTDGRLLAWRFVQRNWQKLRKWFGDVPFTLSSIIEGSTSEFSTQFDLEEVQKFFQEHDAGPGTRSVQMALENIQMNTQWLEQNGETVITWLQTNTT
ncbi:endoplasmic reticulum aminopeptidase 1-like [Saccostrea cucullata]|uniref:endoplasmic reticulum aminopeptidase 1-like n=1 Tax=Saccostrea cuccullata TaxID=36930 RepID=UPI002ECFC826